MVLGNDQRTSVTLLTSLSNPNGPFQGQYKNTAFSTMHNKVVLPIDLNFCKLDDHKNNEKNSLLFSAPNDKWHKEGFHLVKWYTRYCLCPRELMKSALVNIKLCECPSLSCRNPPPYYEKNTSLIPLSALGVMFSISSLILLENLEHLGTTRNYGTPRHAPLHCHQASYWYYSIRVPQASLGNRKCTRKCEKMYLFQKNNEGTTQFIYRHCACFCSTCWLF